MWLTLLSSCIHQQRNYCWPINRFPAIVLMVVQQTLCICSLVPKRSSPVTCVGCFFFVVVLIWTCFIQQDSFHPGPDLSLPPRYVKEETILAVSYDRTTWSNDLSLLTFRRLTKTKTLPPRPPPSKTGPGRPPPPSLQSAGRSQSWNASQKQKIPRKCPVLPPRPNPGHRLYNNYTVRHGQRVPLGTVITSLMGISLYF